MENVKDFIFTNGGKLKVIIDVDTLSDPDMFGQILKTHSFKDELGIKLENSFKDITKTLNGRKFIKKFLGIAQENGLIVASDGNVYVGKNNKTLALSFNGKTVINPDIDKDYGWTWFVEVP